MASDFAPPPQTFSQHEKMEQSPQPPAPAVFSATVNGDHEPVASGVGQEGLVKGGHITADEDHIPSPIEQEGLVKGGQITANEDHIPPTGIDTAVPVDPDRSPAEQVDSGIAPIADFIPKDAAPMSHPTPPPDEPLLSGAADVDVEMANVSTDASMPLEPQTLSQQTPVQAEQSLVRPREEDGDDEPAAKRSRVDVLSTEIAIQENLPDTTLPDAPVLEQAEVTEVTPIVEPLSQPAAAEVIETDVEAIPEPLAETPVGPPIEPPVEPAADAVREPATEPALDAAVIAESTPVLTSDPIPADVKIEEAQADLKPSTAPADSAPSVEASAAIDITPKVETAGETVAPPSGPPAVQPLGKPTYSTAPLTSLQTKSLLDKTKNLKKTKNSSAFLRPVDYVLLNIPTYPDIVKNPMDLSTMEAKLKDGSYGSVQDFADDFDLIISNARRFNGDAHPVTQAGLSMEAYFRRMMESVPTADQTSVTKTEKRSPSIATEKPRREPRVIPPPPAPATTAQAEAFALQPDGTPQIRRQSSISNRPARAIKPPQSREISYSKPKRKENQLELRFCENILDELRSPKYATTNHVFMYPVDPVALNIPNYRSIVKHPMDMSTMSQKLKGGQYSNASEFKKDFDLIIENCLAFNPVGNVVRDLGIQFQRQFEELWQGKEKWERKNQPVSNRASSASGDEESGADDEEEDVDEDESADAATIRALKKQLADMQNALTGLAGTKQSKKKAKAAKTGNKKALLPAKKIVPAKAPAVKAKKPKVVTYEEKQEISEAVGNMNDKQVSKLTDIITQNVAKYADADEMELEIDDLPNNVQIMLLEYVRKIFGNPKKKAREPSPDDAAALDDDDYEERGGSKGGKRKKHKPMGKQEQQDTIYNIKSKLAQFSQAATSGSESPTNSSFAAPAQVDTSGDEESEESEEE